MKRLFILDISLALLAGCGMAVLPEAPTTEATTVVTTTEETTTELVITDAKPFTKDDIAAIEANYKTVGDYVKAVPAAWYEVNVWWAMDGEITIKFFDHKPKENSQPFLYLLSRDIIPEYTHNYDDNDNYIGEYEPLAQELPKALLDAKKVEIHYLDFFKVSSAIVPPRGIKIGDNAQKLFDVYPDYRSEDGTILYDITTLYPWAESKWGNTEWEPPDDGIVGWERAPEYGFIGGRIWKESSHHIARFIFMEKPYEWDERSDDYPWASNIYQYHWLLEYTIEENIIQDIIFRISHHPG